MLPNIGIIDRAIRLILGMALLIDDFNMDGLWHGLAVPGAFLLLTAVFAICPAYSYFHINTDASPTKRHA